MGLCLFPAVGEKEEAPVSASLSHSTGAPQDRPDLWGSEPSQPRPTGGVIALTHLIINPFAQDFPGNIV